MEIDPTRDQAMDIEPRGLDFGVQADDVEIQFVRIMDTPTGKQEFKLHKFSANRNYIKTYFPGLGAGSLLTSGSAGPIVLRHFAYNGNDTLDDSADDAKTAERIYRYYEDYLKNVGKLPSFAGITLQSSNLKDIPGATERELKLATNGSKEAVSDALTVLRVANYICESPSPVVEWTRLVTADVFNSMSIDDAFRMLGIDGKEYDMTPEEMNIVIAENPHAFAWLKAPEPPAAPKKGSSSSSAQDDANLPVVTLD